MLESNSFAVERVTREQLAARGIDTGSLLVEVQQATSFPPPSIRPPKELLRNLHERQLKAESIWIATHNGQLIGTGLIEPVDNERILYKLAGTNGEMFEVGGFAVDLQFQRHGIARLMLAEMLNHLHQTNPDATVVTVTWPGGVSDAWCQKYAEFLGPFQDEAAITVHAWRIPHHGLSASD